MFKTAKLWYYWTAKKPRKKLKKRLQRQLLKKKCRKKIPHLAAVMVGTDGASMTYVSSKVKACARVGFNSTLIDLPEDTTEEQLLHEIAN